MTPGQRRAPRTSTSSTRDRLVDATVDLIGTNGPQAATSRAITEAADANLGAITYYFGSKDALVAHAMAAVARTLLEPVVAELTRRDVDPVQNLLGSIQMLNRLFNENHELLPAYLHTLAAAATDDSVQDAVRELHRTLVSVLQESISHQQREGLLPAWITPEPMAQLILATANGIIVAAATDPDRTNETAIGAQFAQLLLSTRTNPLDRPAR